MITKFLINKEKLKFNEAQAFTEEIIKNLFKEINSTYIFLTYLKEAGNSIGLYYKYTSKENTYRRLTGGPEISFHEDYEYITILTSRVETLKKINDRAKNIAKCVSGIEPYAGISLSRDKKLLYGITKLGNVGLIEIITNNNNKDVNWCIEHLFENVIEEKINAKSSQEAANSYLKDSWILYGNKNYELSSSSTNNGFFINLNAKIKDNYIEHILLTGNFYASPPMEPINAVLALEGTPINEVYFYGIKARFKKIEIEGLNRENVFYVLDDLYNKLINFENK
ncbi:hypothetical protein [Caldisphaera sp.]|uniref:hypothetical protein n=1 Tax=Caldisphaera sp. TaxID=2060322 RepID=UPI003D0C9812